MVIKILKEKNKKFKSYVPLLIAILFLITVPNAAAIHYYQFKIRFQNNEIVGSNVSLKITNSEVPNLKHSGPYTLQLLSKKGEVMGEKDFDIKEKILIEKRLRSGEWNNTRQRIQTPTVLINYPYQHSISKALVKSGDKKIGEIQVKKNINLTIKICGDRKCSEGKIKNFVKNEVVWITKESNPKNLGLETYLSFPDNHTEKIEFPKKLILERKGNYIIKSTASKIGYGKTKETREIQVEENENNLFDIVVGVVILTSIITLLIVLRKGGVT